MTKYVRRLGPDIEYFGTDGTKPLSGGLVYCYQAGTTTPVNTYTDNTGNTANTNPLILNSSGRLTTNVYVNQAMKFVLTNSTDTNPPTNPIWTADNVPTTDQLWTMVAKNTNYTVVVSDSYKVFEMDDSSGNLILSLPASATVGNGFIMAAKKVSNSTNTITVTPNGSEKIDAASTYVLSDQNSSILFITDGVGWEIISQNFGNGLINSSIFTFARGVTVSSGNLLISSGNATLTSGNLVLTAGNATLTAGNLKLSNGNLDVVSTDTRTNTVTRNTTIDAETSGIAAPSIGTGILVAGTTLTGATQNYGALDFVATTVTASAEQTNLTISARAAGAALAPSYILNQTGVGNVTFNSAATTARTITLPDNNITLLSYGARAYNSTTQTLSSAVATKVSLQTKDWDSQSNFDATTNYRFTVPTGGDGKYIISGLVSYTITTSVAYIIQCYIYKNGTTVSQLIATTNIASGNVGQLFAATTGILNLVATDYIELWTFQAAAGSGNLVLLTGELSLMRIGT